MTKVKVLRADPLDQPANETAELLGTARALAQLADEFRAQAQARAWTRSARAGGIDLTRCTPDELLDAWQALRGPKAEAFLLGRIYRRRAARRLKLS